MTGVSQTRAEEEMAVAAASARVLRAVAGQDGAALAIAVTCHQVWWTLVDDPDGLAIRDASAVGVRVGVPVRIELRSDAVIHSIRRPPVAGKMDMIPGRETATVIEATQPGRFRGQRPRVCGLSHPLMAFELVAVPPVRFRTSLEALQDGASEAAGPAAAAGASFSPRAAPPAIASAASPRAPAWAPTSPAPAVARPATRGCGT